MPIITIWFAYRILTSLWAAIISALQPFTELEKNIVLWPPSIHLGTWLVRAFLSPWQRWDTEWYLKIVTSGYRAEDGTAQFHPLFAWLAVPLARLGLDPLFSLLLISSIAGLLMLILFEKLAQLDMETKTAQIASILLISFPTAFILFAPYTESLFLLCAVGCMLFMRTRRWILAGVLGGLAALTRQQGVFLVFPLAWELWESSERNLKLAVKSWRALLGVIGPAFGLGIWFFYRALFLNDFNVEAGNLKSLVYSGLVSRSAVHVVAYQILWPWQALWIALKQFKFSDTDLLIDLLLAGIFLILIVLSWRQLRNSYRVYVAAITLISFSYYTGPIHPYLGLPRHLFLAFPVFIGMAPLLLAKKRWLIWLLAGLPLMLLMIAGYVEHGWVP
jgi:Gpi18-like mannosyltransferase